MPAAVLILHKIAETGAEIVARATFLYYTIAEGRCDMV